MLNTREGSCHNNHSRGADSHYLIYYNGHPFFPCVYASEPTRLKPGIAAKVDGVQLCSKLGNFPSPPVTSEHSEGSQSTNML